MSFARVNGAVLHWREDGPREAPAVLFANSLGSDLRIWDDVVAALAKEFRLVRYDKRGHGLSDVATPFGIDDHASDVAALLDHAGIGPCALVGISMGGMIAQRFAVRFPNRVRALVLCDTAAKIGTAEIWNERIRAIRQSGMAAVAETVIQRWFAPGFRVRAPEAWQG